MPGIYVLIGVAIGCGAGLLVILIGGANEGLSRSLGGPGLTVLIGAIAGAAISTTIYQFTTAGGGYGEHVVQVHSEEEFDEVVLRSDKPALVDFYADWCAPCSRMKPVVSEIAEETQGRAVVAAVDIDRQEGLSRRYNATRIPHFVIFRDGRPVKTFKGVQSKDTLLDALLERGK